MRCNQQIGIDAYQRIVKCRGFQPPWYKVAIYYCPACGGEHRARVNWTGGCPRGAFICGLPLSSTVDEVNARRAGGGPATVEGEA